MRVFVLYSVRVGHGSRRNRQHLARVRQHVNPNIAITLFSEEPAAARRVQGALAKFDHGRQALVVHRALFAEDDGSVAAILCHEFRHSRQSSPKRFRYALSFLFVNGGDASIVENDAMLYEREARAAIFWE
jgi:hypothetical protein